MLLWFVTTKAAKHPSTSVQSQAVIYNNKKTNKRYISGQIEPTKNATSAETLSYHTLIAIKWILDLRILHSLRSFTSYQNHIPLQFI